MHWPWQGHTHWHKCTHTCRHTHTQTDTHRAYRLGVSHFRDNVCCSRLNRLNCFSYKFQINKPRLGKVYWFISDLYYSLAHEWVDNSNKNNKNRGRTYETLFWATFSVSLSFCGGALKKMWSAKLFMSSALIFLLLSSFLFFFCFWWATLFLHRIKGLRKVWWCVKWVWCWYKHVDDVLM